VLINGGYGFLSFAIGKGDRHDLLGIFLSFLRKDQHGNLCKKCIIIDLFERKQWILGYH
jgi:hypothetical protein